MGQDPATVPSVCVAWGYGDSHSLTPAELLGLCVGMHVCPPSCVLGVCLCTCVLMYL